MTLWTELPNAKAILASCVANPPASTEPRSPHKRGIEMDARGPKYDRTDKRVIALCKLWDAATDLTHCPSYDRDRMAWAAFRDAWGVQYECTVDVAITTALAADHYAAEAAKLDIAA